ncbi:MAG: hypothetical protein WBW84_18070 [Acidobacteriaceae bacterium]
MSAIAGGTGWICPPAKLERLRALALNGQQKEEIEGWVQQWGQQPALIQAFWYPEDHPTFSVLQYQALTLAQLRAKVAQFPPGTRLLWQFSRLEHVTPAIDLAKQEAVYNDVRAIAEKHSVILIKANPSE